MNLLQTSLKVTQKQSGFPKQALLLILWLHGPFSLTLASLLIAVHSFLSCAFILHRRVFISSSTSFSNLNYGLPVSRLPSGFETNTFLATRALSILMICPSHSNLLTKQALLKCYIHRLHKCVRQGFPTFFKWRHT
jgi:hypothetical protein